MAELDTGLVDELVERLRSFQLRLGENTAGFIIGGRRSVQLSGSERRELAGQLAPLVDELAERRRAEPAGPGHHVLVTVDPGRNFGRPSISRGMVPIWAAASVLRAGEPVEVVREEFGLTGEEVAVVAALASDVDDLAGVPPAEDTCRPVEVTVDGRPEVVRVRGAEPMTELDRAMFAELVAAARARAGEDEHMGVRQELAMAWMKAAARIPEGQEKTRLRAAVRAAQTALTARRDHGDGGEIVDIP